MEEEISMAVAKPVSQAMSTDAALALAVQLGYDINVGTRWHADNTVTFRASIARPTADEWLGDDVEDSTAAAAILKAIEVARKAESHPAGRMLCFAACADQAA
jgi:hypothetical protein